MSAPAWTPGPWQMVPDATVIDADFREVVAIGDDEFPATEQDKTNLRLIAAAPELYEALAGLVSLIDANPNAELAEMMMVWRTASDGESAARAALAKARGEP